MSVFKDRTGTLERQAALTTAQVTKACEQVNVIMLHLYLRGFFSNIIEITVLIREMSATRF